MEETIQNSGKKSNTTYVRVLMAVVLVLGMLLLGGTALVVGTIISRVNNPAPAALPASQPAEPLTLDRGESILRVETSGDNIIIHTERRLIILDANTGEEKSRIILGN